MDNKGTAPGCEKKHFGESWPARICLPEHNQKKQFHARWLSTKGCNYVFPKLAEMKSITDLFTQG